MRAKIFRILKGAAGAISGHLTRQAKRKETVQRKTASSGRRPLGRTGTKGKQKAGRVGSLTVPKRHLRRTPKPIEPNKENSNLSSRSRIAIYSCPTCGLQAPKTLMVEHLLGSPTHRRGLAESEQANDHEVKEEAKVRHEDPSRDSVRDLLQILLPPRPFGRRHEQQTVKL